MGVRTQHQLDAKAQLVVRTTRDPAAVGFGPGRGAAGAAGGADEGSGDEAAALDAAAAGAPADGELRGLSADSDVLPMPRLLDAGGGASRPAMIRAPGTEGGAHGAGPIAAWV
jgi:hypothetical protein